MAYEKQTWVNGESITQEKLNHMENGISEIKEDTPFPQYEKQTWQTGEVITAERLNHMENGIADTINPLNYFGLMLTYPVGHELDYSFNQVQSVFIGNPITTLKGGAFSQFSYAIYFYIANVETLAPSLSFPSSIQQIAAPKTRTIAAGTFSEKQDLVTAVFPSVETIGNGAFNKTGITEFTFENVKTIGDDAFMYAELSGQLNLPKLESLGGNAFQPFGVTGAIMPNLKSIGTAPFGGGSADGEIYIGDSLESIDEGAFGGYSGTINLGFPEGKFEGAPWGATYPEKIHYNVPVPNVE